MVRRVAVWARRVSGRGRSPGVWGPVVRRGRTEGGFRVGHPRVLGRPSRCVSDSVALWSCPRKLISVHSSSSPVSGCRISGCHASPDELTVSVVRRPAVHLLGAARWRSGFLVIPSWVVAAVAAPKPNTCLGDMAAASAGRGAIVVLPGRGELCVCFVISFGHGADQSSPPGLGEFISARSERGAAAARRPSANVANPLVTGSAPPAPVPSSVVVCRRGASGVGGGGSLSLARDRAPRPSESAKGKWGSSPPSSFSFSSSFPSVSVSSMPRHIAMMLPGR